MPNKFEVQKLIDEALKPINKRIDNLFDAHNISVDTINANSTDAVVFADSVRVRLEDIDANFGIILEKSIKPIAQRLEEKENFVRMLHEGIVKWEKQYNLLWNNYSSFVAYMVNLLTTAGERNSCTAFPRTEEQFQGGLLAAGKRLMDQARATMEEIKRTRQAQSAPASVASANQASIEEIITEAVKAGQNDPTTGEGN